MSKIDRINRKILQELEKNGRISNTALSETVGLSPSACLRRVQDLEHSGVIKGYRAVIDRRKLGAKLTVFILVGLSAQNAKDSRNFEDALAGIPEVRECHNVTGSVEYLLRVEVEDLEDFKAFHADTLSALPQVDRIISYMTLSTSKDLRG